MMPTIAAQTTAYDPTCGSAAFKSNDEAEKRNLIVRTRKETATAGLARIDMILHNKPSGTIWADHVGKPLGRRRTAKDF
jgi:type I restriction enzyme M protein